MPGAIVEAATFDPTIEYPNDGEGATSASVKDTFVQRLANRARWLYAQATTTGWWRIRTVTTEGDLRGRTVTGTGDHCYYTEHGLYRYDALSVVAEDIPWIIESDFGGRWVHELASVRAAQLATLTALGRLVQLPPYAMINQTTASFGASPDTDYATTTSASWTDTTALVSMTNVQIGDEIDCAVHFSAAASSSFIGRVRLAYEHNGTVTGLSETETRVDGTTVQHLALVARKVVASSFSAGTPHKFMLQIQSNSADTMKLKGMINFVMRQVRP